MKSGKLTEVQKKLLESMLSIEYTSFGDIKEFESQTDVEVYASGHPICSPPVGWCAAGNYVSGPGTTCPSGSTTYTWCAS